ncbi:MAG: phytoene/squalene synthase family protein [Microbacteriaceae bacterium]|nr:phytoene/squalene synthase family protein [Burkholderiaceae bacterium]
MTAARDLGGLDDLGDLDALGDIPVGDSASNAVYAAADALLSQRGHSFHWARRLLSAPHAERATRLYGFCRRIDDLADEGPSPAAARDALAIIRQALQTRRSDDPAMRDMLQLMRGCGIDPAVPLELIQGVESDLGEVRMVDMAELLRYCYRVAGTVGLMMTAALDVTAAEALPHAIDLGIAMQLTNICRDVREDALRGRRYLPATLVGALEPAALIAPTGASRATAVHAVHTLLDLADQHYASGEQGLRHLPSGARAGILVAARVYREIGVVLRRRGGDCWSSRARVSAAAKAVVTLQALRALRSKAGLRRGEALGMTHGLSLRILPLYPGATWPEEAGRGD